MGGNEPYTKLSLIDIGKYEDKRTILWRFSENFLVQTNFQNYADEHVQQMQKTLANLRVSVYGARVDRFHQLQSAQESRNFAEVSLYLRTRYCPLEKKGRKRANMRNIKIWIEKNHFCSPEREEKIGIQVILATVNYNWTVEKNEKKGLKNHDFWIDNNEMNSL